MKTLASPTEDRMGHYERQQQVAFIHLSFLLFLMLNLTWDGISFYCVPPFLYLIRLIITNRDMARHSGIITAFYLLNREIRCLNTLASRWKHEEGGKSCDITSGLLMLPLHLLYITPCLQCRLMRDLLNLC